MVGIPFLILLNATTSFKEEREQERERDLGWEWEEREKERVRKKMNEGRKRKKGRQMKKKSTLNISLACVLSFNIKLGTYSTQKFNICKIFFLYSLVALVN